MFDEEGYDGDDEDWENKDFLGGMEEADEEDTSDAKKKKSEFSDELNDFDQDFEDDFHK